MMDWSPNRWTAAMLGFLFPPLGALYVAQGGLVVTYTISLIALVILSFFLGPQDATKLTIVAGVIPLLCAINCYTAASDYEIRDERPWFTKSYALIVILVGVILTIAGTRVFLFEPFRYPSSSMEKAIPTGAQILVKKWGYGHYDAYGIVVASVPMSAVVNRGDIIAFTQLNKPLIKQAKRVIGLPGDVVELKNKVLFVNRQAISRFVFANAYYEVYEEQIDKAKYDVHYRVDEPAIDFSVTVPEQSYYVLGDSRGNSVDSRMWGPVSAKNIIGSVVYVAKQNLLQLLGLD